jgi:hypothetical protein
VIALTKLPWLSGAARVTAIRLLIAVVLGVVFAGYSDYFRNRTDMPPSDFQQPRQAGELLLAGKNPYALIGPDRPVHHQFYLIYPATAAAAAMPFTFLPPRVADALFVGVGVALLAWALTRKTLANPQLLVFTSFAIVTTAQTVQWSPYLTAATMMPWLGVLYACKPSVALAYLAAFPSRIAIIGATAFGLLTLAIWPWWVAEWLTMVRTVTHMSAPVMRPGGFLLLLALLRWRRPEARLLVGLACIPQTPVLYEVVPLFLLVTTMKEGLLLGILTCACGLLVHSLGSDIAGYNEWMTLSGRWMVWLVYLPSLMTVLRRPNEFPAHAPSRVETARAAAPLRYCLAIFRIAPLDGPTR